MTQRINYYKVDPELLRLMMQFEEYAKTTEIPYALRELIKTRASQINGCAFCLDMHTRDALAAGEKPQRLFCLNAWRECSFYTEAERVALELTEAVTLIAQGGVSDDLFRRVRAHFTEKQYCELLALINTINSWNRLSIAMGNQPAEAK
ncbi:MAG TPA: carboxymuconolactone decarboxylase family protein [Symbiobacteriaceae bacterium]|nr:carboxymuconolactone decarboxylase family protein [Symbiobacteriaceae bacterium]